MRTSPNWSICVVGLCLLALSGCAATPCPAPAAPPPYLMVPPPPPGAMSDRLEAILKQGQTSAPTSADSPSTVTPK